MDTEPAMQSTERTYNLPKEAYVLFKWPLLEPKTLNAFDDKEDKVI